MEIAEKKEKTLNIDFFERFPRQIRDKNIIPCFDKPGPKQVGYKWGDYVERPYPKEVLVKHEGNYALITGDPLNEGGYLIVLDIDNPFFCHYFKDEETFTIKTPGGGYHLYYHSLTPIGNKNSLFRLPIDIRGVGGYIIIPPSKYGDKDYRVIKDLPIKPINDFKELLKSKIPNNLTRFYDQSKEKNIEEFKNKLHKEMGINILDVVLETHNMESEGYSLNPVEGKGNIVKIANPFEKIGFENSSFLIFKDINKWYNLNDHKSGDVIDYLQEKMNINEGEALKYLSDKYKIPKPSIEKKLDEYFM